MIILLGVGGDSVAATIDLPDSVNYSIYIDGQLRGSSNIEIEQSDDSIVFTSRNRVDFQIATMDIRSRTKADASTFQIRRFEYEGDKATLKLKGTVVVRDDSIFAESITPGRAGKFAIRVLRSHTLFLEDYIMEHEVLIALAQSAAGDGPTEYALLFPSGFASAIATQQRMDEVTLTSDTAEALTTRIQVSIEGSDPYDLYFDPKRSLPIYMVFPTTRAEVFLDSFYGASPQTRFLPVAEN